LVREGLPSQCSDHVKVETEIKQKVTSRYGDRNRIKTMNSEKS